MTQREEFVEDIVQVRNVSDIANVMLGSIAGIRGVVNSSRWVTDANTMKSVAILHFVGLEVNGVKEKVQEQFMVNVGIIWG